MKLASAVSMPVLCGASDSDDSSSVASVSSPTSSSSPTLSTKKTTKKMAVVSRSHSLAVMNHEDDDDTEEEDDQIGCALLSSSSSSLFSEGHSDGAHHHHHHHRDNNDTNTRVPPHVGYKKVLVTGGAGFIGSHVAEYLLKRGDDVIIVDELNDYYDVRIKQENLQLLLGKYGPDRVKIYIGDICNRPLMQQVFAQHQPTFVCHLAARAGVRPSIQDPFIYIQSNIQGTTTLLELCHQQNGNVRNFVFASSSSVYGGSKSTYFSEEEPVDNPVSPYAASKKACELLAYTYHHLYQLNISALRFFTVYGPRGRPDMAPYIFVDRISRGLEIQQFGDGSSSRDYTYIDDIVNGIVRALDRPYGYEIFNLGKGDGTSLKEFIDLVQLHTGQTAKIQRLPDQPGDVPYTCADISKAQELLGYQPKISFAEGIGRTVAWYQQQQQQQRRLEQSSVKQQQQQVTLAKTFGPTIALDLTVFSSTGNNHVN